MNGTPASGTTPASSTENCATCYEGYVREGNSCVVQIYPYICLNGIPALGTTSTSSTENCATCYEGYVPEGNSCVVQIYPYRCLYGTPALGTTLVEGTQNCATCYEGYVSEDNRCVIPEYPYRCLYGTPALGTTLVEGTQNCATCYEGYVREGNSCVVEYSYVCLNGTPRTARLPIAGIENCSTCDTGYVLAGHSCVQPVDCNFSDIRVKLSEGVTNINGCTESSIEENRGLSNVRSLLLGDGLHGVTIDDVLESDFWTGSRRSLIQDLTTFSDGVSDYVEYLAADYRPFITEWQVTLGQTVTIPVGVTGGGPYFYAFNCDLDGTINTESRYAEPSYVSMNISSGVSYIKCRYENADSYRIGITGSYFHMNFGDISLTEASKESLHSIIQWGDTAWVSMSSAFKGASMLQSIAQDFPVLFDSRSEGINLSDAFRGTHSFNQLLGNWDVSVVTNMNSMFQSATAFDQPLDNWNVTNVRTCSSFSTSSGLSIDNLPNLTCSINP